MWFIYKYVVYLKMLFPNNSSLLSLFGLIYGQTTWPVSWKIYMQVKEEQLELDMGQ